MLANCPTKSLGGLGAASPVPPKTAPEAAGLQYGPTPVEDLPALPVPMLWKGVNLPTGLRHYLPNQVLPAQPTPQVEGGDLASVDGSLLPVACGVPASCWRTQLPYRTRDA